MRNRVNQIYEEYWSYTAAYTDMNGENFLSVLKKCVEFLDEQQNNTYSTEKYEALQQQISYTTGITMPSVRKAINQLVKLGFLKPYLQGYVPEAKQYLEARTNARRTHILSKIVYRYSNFQNSITDPDAGTTNQIKFLINTLEEVGAIDKRALIALMTTDINEYPRGYLTKEELSDLYKRATDIDFIDRKYNQLGHFLNLLGKLDDLCNYEGAIYFKTDAERMFGNIEPRKEVRDPYLQRIYKKELEDESRNNNEGLAKCMVEGLNYPVLIASHIKPYSHCRDDEQAQFDVNNGLLLSKNMDSLFDLGYMTFDGNGVIIPSQQLDRDVINYLAQYKLDEKFINEERMNYMDYHRNNVFEKRFSTNIVRRFVFQEINQTI